MNMQNLPRDKTKSKLRQAILAPPGHKLIAADLSQIEARIVAEICGQKAMSQAFRKGIDVYADFASVVFGHTVTKNTYPAERFIGKTGMLGLSYGCGKDRFYQMVVTSARQANIELDPKQFDIHMAEFIVNTYRNMFSKIRDTWYEFDRLKATYLDQDNRSFEIWEPVKFKARAIVLPNKMTLRYEKQDENIYGAKLLENITQALARIVIMQAAARLAQRGLRFVLQSHDELVFAVPESAVDVAKEAILEEMVRPPAWLPELPLAVEIGVGDNYGETK